MAEFCLDCFNEYFSEKKLTEKDVIMDFDLCEECGKWKPCVIRLKEKNIFKYIIRRTTIIFRRIAIFMSKKY